MADSLFTEAGSEGPVTVSLSRKVKPGRDADYEAWISGVVAEASVFPGHQGAHVLRPRQPGGEYVLIYRYDTYAHCQAWEDSLERAKWLAKLDDLVEGEATMKRVTGLESWFDLPEVPVAAKPPPHKMAITLIVVVFVIVWPLNVYVGPVLTDLGLPLPVKIFVIATIQVLLMTYLVMPRVTRLIRGWLFKP
ncbi:MAG: antibiotic biosynthesis monooxygenase [Rhodospirillum sp.]|nr:antibiotic biosynthesis monooxygenase [Rhodospirillum sp.]MCF8488736.1 antibiotic biosynthesis monooxygenase [Rhodospirillum sp.]MCF8503067.1 antibiotic biosynthesis monooxygenase [Rhodospirillum sp.]